MQKRGQITIFLVIGLIIVILAGIFFYFNRSSLKSKFAYVPDRLSNDAEIVKAYAETCIKMLAEEALFEKIGMQGGYIDVSAPAALYQSNEVPYYTDGAATEIPALDDISKRISDYVNAEFRNCFGRHPFREIGYTITPLSAIKTDVSINEEDVSVAVNYSLSVNKDNTETILESYGIILPIRLGFLYESAVGSGMNSGLLRRIMDAQASSNTYIISSSDCPDSLTNIYLKDSDDGNGKIIQFADFSTYYEHYFNSYIFQFAVKNVQVSGGCAI